MLTLIAMTKCPKTMLLKQWPIQFTWKQWKVINKAVTASTLRLVENGGVYKRCLRGLKDSPYSHPLPEQQLQWWLRPWERGRECKRTSDHLFCKKWQKRLNIQSSDAYFGRHFCRGSTVQDAWSSGKMFRCLQLLAPNEMRYTQNGWPEGVTSMKMDSLGGEEYSDAADRVLRRGANM